jgi:hypothetical protein
MKMWDQVIYINKHEKFIMQDKLTNASINLTRHLQYLFIVKINICRIESKDFIKQFKTHNTVTQIQRTMYSLKDIKKKKNSYAYSLDSSNFRQCKSL